MYLSKYCATSIIQCIYITEIGLPKIKETCKTQCKILEQYEFTRSTILYNTPTSCEAHLTISKCTFLLKCLCVRRNSVDVRPFINFFAQQSVPGSL